MMKMSDDANIVKRAASESRFLGNKYLVPIPRQQASPLMWQTLVRTRLVSEFLPWRQQEFRCITPIPTYEPSPGIHQMFGVPMARLSLKQGNVYDSHIANVVM